MKILFLTLATIFTFSVYSQEIDKEKINTIENKLETFKFKLKCYTESINNLTNTDSIKTITKTMINQSNDLISEINKNFKINDDYLIEFSINITLSQTNPNLASFYQTQAITKMYEGEKAFKPNYYKNLININKLTKQIYRANELSKVKKLNIKIMNAYQEIMSIKVLGK